MPPAHDVPWPTREEPNPALARVRHQLHVDATRSLQDIADAACADVADVLEVLAPAGATVERVPA